MKRSASSDEIHALLLLLAAPRLGHVTLRRALLRRGSACAVLRHAATDFSEPLRAGLDAAGTRAQAARWAATIDATPIEVLILGGPGYPERLLHLTDPPPALFALGRLELLESPAVGVVGTRRCTSYGADATRLLADSLGRAGVPVISGMARGIDGLAHRSALDAGGPTIAVLGTGLDVVYPREHRALQREIATHGLLLSEHPPGTGPRRHHFVARNRILAALSQGVVVVEAGHGSGALSTSDFAEQLGREVMAVPGPIGRPQSAGTNHLLQDGATFIATPDDVHHALGLPLPPERAESMPASPDDSECSLLAALTDVPLPLDDLAAAAGLTAAEAAGLLLDLEIAGRVRRLPGARFEAVRARATGTLPTG